jgi:hypothetical protein
MRIYEESIKSFSDEVAKRYKSRYGQLILFAINSIPLVGKLIPEFFKVIIVDEIAQRKVTKKHRNLI